MPQKRPVTKLPRSRRVMLELDSPNWAKYTAAYGDASNVPLLFANLRAASPDKWDDAKSEFSNAIMHQGDVDTATYAIAPHLLEYAADLGPGKQSDELLFTIAYASRGGPGPDVPEALEEAWEDAQDEARDLILERLLRSETSEEWTGCLIAGLLYLSGEWSVGSVVNDWCWGFSMVARCPTCGRLKGDAALFRKELRPLSRTRVEDSRAVITRGQASPR